MAAAHNRIDRRICLLLLRGRQSLRTRELAQLVVRRGHLPIRTNRGEGFEQRFRIRERDPNPANARRRVPSASATGVPTRRGGGGVEKLVASVVSWCHD